MRVSAFWIGMIVACACSVAKTMPTLASLNTSTTMDNLDLSSTHAETTSTEVTNGLSTSHHHGNSNNNNNSDYSARITTTTVESVLSSNLSSSTIISPSLNTSTSVMASSSSSHISRNSTDIVTSAHTTVSPNKSTVISDVTTNGAIKMLTHVASSTTPTSVLNTAVNGESQGATHNSVVIDSSSTRHAHTYSDMTTTVSPSLSSTQKVTQDLITSSRSDAQYNASTVVVDLICYACNGNLCPNKRYRFLVRHLVTGAQACYKEWNDGVTNATRRGFTMADLEEFKTRHPNKSLTGCDTIDRSGGQNKYCFCQEKYCNSTSILSSYLYQQLFLVAVLLAYL